MKGRGYSLYRRNDSASGVKAGAFGFGNGKFHDSRRKRDLDRRFWVLVAEDGIELALTTDSK
jgi:hypothetical protein